MSRIRSDSSQSAFKIQQAEVGKAHEAEQVEVHRTERVAQGEVKVPSGAIDSKVAGDFAADQAKPKTGQSPMDVRLEQPVGESQQEMNQRAAADMRTAQKAMQGASKALVAALDPDPMTKADLADAQKKFEAFARAEATFGSNLEARGGSLAPLIYSGIAGDMFKERTELLRRVKETGSIPGDTSANLDGAGSQQEMNMAAMEAYDAANTKMEQMVSALERQLADDPEGLAELKSAQDAFAAFREAHATAAGNLEARGGSLFNLVYAGVAETVTHARSAQLEEKLTLLGASAPDPMDLDGDGLTSQAEMNAAAFQRAEKAMEAMALAFERVLDAFGYDGQLGPELAAAQIAFETFAHADALFYANATARGGSMMPMLYEGSRGTLFEQRAKDLKQAANSGDFPYYGTADVDDAGGQQGMNQAAHAAFEKVDAKLDQALAKLGAMFADDPESTAELQQAHQAFVSYRKKQAEVAGNALARGGSMFGMIYAAAAEGLTQARLDQINGYLADLGGE